MAGIKIEPVLRHPTVALPGRRYIFTVDLRLPPGTEWPDPKREEFTFYCMPDPWPLFKAESEAEPLVLHRFGGTYGPARFVFTAADMENTGTVAFTLTNESGVPVTVLETAEITIHREEAFEAPTDEPARAFQLQSGSIRSLVILESRGEIVTCARSGVTTLDLRTGEIRHVLEFDQDVLSLVGLSEDAVLLCEGGTLYRVAGRNSTTVASFSAQIACFAVYENTAAVALQDGTVRFVDVAKAKVESGPIPTGGPLIALAIGSNDYVVGVQQNGTITAFRRVAGTIERQTFSPPSGHVRRVIWSNYEFNLGLEDGSVEPFQRPASRSAGEASAVTAMARRKYPADGPFAMLFAGHEDGTIDIHDLNYGCVLGTIRAHGSAVSAIGCADTELVSSSANSSIKVWPVPVYSPVALYLRRLGNVDQRKSALGDLLSTLTNVTVEPFANEKLELHPVGPTPDLLSGELVRRAQQMLREEGFYRSAIDGAMGPLTRKAITEFQQEHNLPAAGELDEPTIKALRIRGADEQVPATVIGVCADEKQLHGPRFESYFTVLVTDYRTFSWHKRTPQDQFERIEDFHLDDAAGDDQAEAFRTFLLRGIESPKTMHVRLRLPWDVGGLTLFKDGAPIVEAHAQGFAADLDVASGKYELEARLNGNREAIEISESDAGSELDVFRPFSALPYRVGVLYREAEWEFARSLRSKPARSHTWTRHMRVRFETEWHDDLLRSDVLVVFLRNAAYEYERLIPVIKLPQELQLFLIRSEETPMPRGFKDFAFAFEGAPWTAWRADQASEKLAAELNQVLGRAIETRWFDPISRLDKHVYRVRNGRGRNEMFANAFAVGPSSYLTVDYLHDKSTYLLEQKRTRPFQVKAEAVRSHIRLLRSDRSASGAGLKLSSRPPAVHDRVVLLADMNASLTSSLVPGEITSVDDESFLVWWAGDVPRGAGGAPILAEDGTVLGIEYEILPDGPHHAIRADQLPHWFLRGPTLA